MSDELIPIEIKVPIIGCSVVSKDVPAALPVQNNSFPVSDVDPRYIRIERRNEGSWNSITHKCIINTSNGTEKIYFSIGFDEVTGTIDGKNIVIERPLEFFVPSVQNHTSQEWVTACMRLLSMAARGGYVSKALADLRQVRSETPIWYGKYPNGKSRVHTSLIAVVAWMMQEILVESGYFVFDEETLEYKINDLDKLNNIWLLKNINRKVINDLTNNKSKQLPVSNIDSVTNTNDKPLITSGTCPQNNCGGSMISQSGCLVCINCGYSKCG